MFDSFSEGGVFVGRTMVVVVGAIVLSVLLHLI